MRLTLERGTFVVRAARGTEFTISTAVLGRVLKELDPVLVGDVGDDDVLGRDVLAVDGRMPRLD